MDVRRDIESRLATSVEQNEFVGQAHQLIEYCVLLVYREGAACATSPEHRAKYPVGCALMCGNLA
jgi:hypothetical protein